MSVGNLKAVLDALAHTGNYVVDTLWSGDTNGTVNLGVPINAYTRYIVSYFYATNYGNEYGSAVLSATNGASFAVYSTKTSSYRRVTIRGSGSNNATVTTDTPSGNSDRVHLTKVEGLKEATNQ